MISGTSMGGGSAIGGMAAAGAAGAAAAIATIATAGAAPAAAGALGAAGSSGAAGAAGAGGISSGGLAGAINSSFAGGAASSVGGATSSGVGASTGGGAATKGQAPQVRRLAVVQLPHRLRPATASSRPLSRRGRPRRAAVTMIKSDTKGGAVSSGSALSQAANGGAKALGVIASLSVPGMENAHSASLGAGVPTSALGEARSTTSAEPPAETVGAESNVIRPDEDTSSNLGRLDVSSMATSNDQPEK